MKTKLTALLLAAALTLTLAACGEKTNADTPLPDEPPEPARRAFAVPSVVDALARLLQTQP